MKKAILQFYFYSLKGIIGIEIIHKARKVFFEIKSIEFLENSYKKES